MRAARVGAERHAGGLHTPGTGRGGTLHTLVTSCLGRNNNTNHEYFIRKCLLQNYIKLVNGYSWSVGTAQNKTNHYGNLLDIFFLCMEIFFCLVSPTPRVPAGRAPLPTATSDGCRGVGLQLESRARPRLGGSEAVCPGLRVCCLEIRDSWTDARHGGNVMDRSCVIIFTLSLNNMMDHNCITIPRMDASL